MIMMVVMVALLLCERPESPRETLSFLLKEEQKVWREGRASLQEW